MEFKVGDKVRIIDNTMEEPYKHSFNIGEVVTIDEQTYYALSADGSGQWVTEDDIELEECVMKQEEKKENNTTTAIKAAMNVLGIKKGSKIDLYDEHGERNKYSPYKFDGKKLVDNEGDLSETEIGRLISGRYTFKIVEEGQFIPENGEEYWYVDEDGHVAYVVCNEDEVDAARVAFGNAFEEESIARNNVKNVLDKVHKVFNEEDENKEDC